MYGAPYFRVRMRRRRAWGVLFLLSNFDERGVCWHVLGRVGGGIGC